MSASTWQKSRRSSDEADSARRWRSQLKTRAAQGFRSGDASRSCSLRHHAATAAFPTPQAFDELGHWGARFDSEANEITLCDDAAVLTAQAPHHDHPARNGAANDDQECRATAAAFPAAQAFDELGHWGTFCRRANVQSAGTQ